MISFPIQDTAKIEFYLHSLLNRQDNLKRVDSLSNDHQLVYCTLNSLENGEAFYRGQIRRFHFNMHFKELLRILIFNVLTDSRPYTYGVIAVAYKGSGEIPVYRI